MQAGWVFSSEESSWDCNGCSEFRGYSDSGNGTLSLQLQGQGVVVPWPGRTRSRHSSSLSDHSQVLQFT